jgi:tetratricopeptide (TPR) repeat protein
MGKRISGCSFSTHWRPVRVPAAVLLCLVAGFNAAAQNADLDKAKVEAGAAFLKSGEVELATKTFLGVLESNPTNWRARALLAQTYLSASDLDKADIELKRVRTLSAPPAVIELIDRQLAGARQTSGLRDELTRLLDIGKTAEALSRVARTDLPESRKQLLRAYVAAVRGEFEEAGRLTNTPELADFNASVTKRAQEFAVAREQALVAMNFPGERYCGENIAEMRFCKDWPRLSAVQQSAWDVIRSGNGKVNAIFTPEKFSQNPFNNLPLVEAARRMRTEQALAILAGFISLAPLHHDAVYAGVVHALNSGSLDATKTAAQRSLNILGSWALRIRRCEQRFDYQPCGVGDEKVSRVREEGWLIVDTRARVLRYHGGQPSTWLSDLNPAPAVLQFEIPFDQIGVIRSTPEAKMSRPDVLALNEESGFLDFGAGRRVPMLLDFTFQVRVGALTPVALKTIEDVVKVLGEMIPNARIEYEPNVTTRSFAQRFFRVASETASELSGGKDRVAEQHLALDREIRASGARLGSSTWQTLTDLKSQDGRSMMDAALENEGFKQDIQALLELALK